MNKPAKYKAQSSKKQSSKQRHVGEFALVATPIGHASDMSLRALETLKNADIIYCEDTRQTQKLLMLHGISGKKLVAAYEHNESKTAAEMVERVGEGLKLAYASDAGLPLISDPGAIIMEKMIEAGAPVTSIPGANAALTALQLSGLPPLPFYMAGFLPPKQKARQDALKPLMAIRATLLFYEAPHRITDTLSDILHILGNRMIAVARELTKLHEEVLRGPCKDVLDTLSSREQVKGECVIVVAPPSGDVQASEDDVDAMLRAALKTLSPRDAAFDVAAKTGHPRRTLYQRILELKKT